MKPMYEEKKKKKKDFSSLSCNPACSKVSCLTPSWIPSGNKFFLYQNAFKMPFYYLQSKNKKR